METQMNDSTTVSRIEMARQRALGTLSRAKASLEQAKTTVPGWAREVEQRAEVQMDALLERVGLIRITRAATLATPAVAAVETVSAPVETAAVEAEGVPVDVESVTISEAPAETASETTEAGETAERPARRRRR